MNAQRLEKGMRRVPVKHIHGYGHAYRKLLVRALRVMLCPSNKIVTV